MAFDAPIGDPVQFLPRFASVFKSVAPKKMKWVFTLHAGAALDAPHASWDRVHVYVDGRQLAPTLGLAGLAARAGWHPSPYGKLVLLLHHYTTSAWYGLRQVRRFPVVSDLQLALDLWHYPVRGREQAEHLLTRMFGPQPPHHG